VHFLLNHVAAGIGAAIWSDDYPKPSEFEKFVCNWSRSAPLAAVDISIEIPYRHGCCSA
jgi:hypothetical protein